MRNILIFLVCIFTFQLFAVEIKEEHLTVASGKIIFLSEAPQETIKGVGNKISGEIFLKEKKVKISIDLTDWKTNSRMQTTHLHENYLETEKFPQAVFDGMIQTYNPETGDVFVLGSITLHGKTKKDVGIKGKVSASDTGYSLLCEFSIQLKDYAIEVPRLLILKVSETVKLNVKLELKQGK